jgi:hypothetical protein
MFPSETRNKARMSVPTNFNHHQEAGGSSQCNKDIREINHVYNGKEVKLLVHK